MDTNELEQQLWWSPWEETEPIGDQPAGDDPGGEKEMKTIEDLIRSFNSKMQTEDKASREARIRAEVWGEALSLVQDLADATKPKPRPKVDLG